MNYFEFKPLHPLLSPYIEYYNSMQGDGTVGKKFISLPEGKVGMVFLLGGHTDISTKNTLIHNNCSRIWGLIQEPNFVSISPDIFTFCVVFKPGGLHHFLPSVPIDEIASASATLVDIFGSEIYKLEDQLFECVSFDQRIQLLETFLLQNMNPPNTRLDTAVQIIEQSAGKITVQNLSKKINISSRQLRNIFNENVGLSPKQFIRMMRFKKVLSSPPHLEENKAQFANRLGFYDESHFIAEFKSFAGMTPNQYFKNLSFISDFSNYKRLMID